MFSSKSVFAVAVLCAALAGCSTTSSGNHYKASTHNIVAIQEQLAGTDKKVKLAPFTVAEDFEGGLWCRAMGPVSIASGKEPVEFIEEAFREELFMAQAYSPAAPVSITGRLDKLQFSSVSPAYWEIALTLTSSNGVSYQAQGRHEFKTSWDAFSACRNVADAFPAAVQEALESAVSDARFKDLL